MRRSIALASASMLVVAVWAWTSCRGQETDTIRYGADLRLRHPYLSLQELADLRRPPLTKSTLNHRFRRIERLVGR